MRVVLFVLTLIGFSLAKEELPEYKLNREKQLVAGVVLLHHSDKYLTNVETNIYMKELLKITEYTPKEAHRILQKYRNRPEKFRRVLEQIEEEMMGKNTNGK